MALDKAKTQKAAEKFIASGKIAQAVEEYLKILKENPKDWNLMIQIGDLYLKINKTAESIGMFTKVADHYYADGFFLKAIAIYKRVNKLDPALIEVCMKLADLYLKQGLSMDAKSQLQAVAQNYVAKNQTKEAIQTFRRLIDIEPENLKTRNELAKAYKNEGMIPEAVKEYLAISDELTRKSLLKESLAVLETAYKLDARNTAILKKILAIYSEQGEVAKSTSLLEESLRADPSNAEVLAFLAESYAGRKQYAKAYETLDRALLNTTNKEPLWGLKGDLYLKEGDLDKAFGQYSLVIERHVQRRENEKAIALMQKLQRVDPSFPPVLQKLVDLYTMAHQETNMLAAYNALIDAFISKAMYLDASKYLEKLIQIEPDNAQHHEKLGFVKSFLEKPKEKELVPEQQFVESPAPGGEISSGDFDLGISLETEPGVSIFETKPAIPPARVVATQPKPTMAPAPAVAELSEEEKDFVSEHLIEAEVFTKYGLIDKAIEQLQIIVGKYPNSVLAHQKLREIYLEKGERDKAVEECVSMSRIFRKQGDTDQAEDLLSEARQINPNHPSLDVAYKEIPAASTPTDVLGEIEKLAQSMKTRPAAKSAPKPAAPAPAPPAPAPPTPAFEDIEIEIEEPEAAAPVAPAKPAAPGLEASAFEEIDFYIGQGLTSEAKRLLHTMRQQHPADPGVLSRLSKLGEKVAAPPAPPPAPEPAPPAVEEEIEVPVEEISFNLEEETVAPPLDLSMAESVEEAPAETAASGLADLSIDLEEEIQIETGEGPPSVEETWDFGPTGQKVPKQEPAPAPAEGFDLGMGVSEEESAPVLSEETEGEESLADLNIEIPEEVEQQVEPQEEVSIELPPMEDDGPTTATLEKPAEVSFEMDEEEASVDLEMPVELELPDEIEAVSEDESLELTLEPEVPDVVEEEPQTGEKEAPASFDEIEADLEPTDFGELDSEVEISVEPAAAEEASVPDVESTPAAPTVAEVAPVEAAPAEEAPAEEEDSSLSDALDAAFDGATEAEPSTPVKASQELFQEEDDFFDLAAELEEGFLNVQSAVEETERPADGQNYSLEEILTDFKKGVEKQLGAEDYDTRYNLGIAYKEMGLIDEAIAEFQIASKDSKRFLECCSMLGLCFIEKGMAKLAIKWYQRGLETPNHTDEEYQGLRFELAQAYEVTGELDKAFDTYQEVYGANASYRNVSKKMKELEDQLKKK